MTLAWALVPAPPPLRQLTVGVTEVGVLCLAFRDGAGRLSAAARRTGHELVVDPARTNDAGRQLAEYLAGKRREFTLPLDWSLASGAHRAVLQRLAADVGYGRTTTYGALARSSGAFPTADGVIGARAVGTIMGANPLPVLVACHRVLAADGLGGFGGGLPPSAGCWSWKVRCRPRSTSEPDRCYDGRLGRPYFDQVT